MGTKHSPPPHSLISPQIYIAALSRYAKSSTYIRYFAYNKRQRGNRCTMHHKVIAADWVLYRYAEVGGEGVQETIVDPSPMARARGKA